MSHTIRRIRKRHETTNKVVYCSIAFLEGVGAVSLDDPSIAAVLAGADSAVIRALFFGGLRVSSSANSNTFASTCLTYYIDDFVNSTRAK